jgi:hypothetical protein
VPFNPPGVPSAERALLPHRHAAATAAGAQMLTGVRGLSSVAADKYGDFTGVPNAVL